MLLAIPDYPMFSFGTLMDEQLLCCVSGMERTALNIQPAVLRGYAQRLVTGEEFPVIIPVASSEVPGVLITGLHEEAMRRILFYEGEEYRLTEIELQVVGRGLCSAVYFADNNIYQTQHASWDFEQWQTSHKAEFLVRTASYMALYGSMSAAEADKHW